MSTRRIFAGARLRAIRTERRLKQSELAASLAISTSYLSQLENDDRPLTPALVERLSRAFPLDWREVAADDAASRLAALRDANADPLFGEPLDPAQLARFAEQQPALAERFIMLHEAYRRTGQRLEMVDEALASDSTSAARLPWEEVRDWFHFANNYVDSLDRAAEALAARLGGLSPETGAIEGYLRDALSVSLIYSGQAGLRSYDAEMGHLTIDPGQPVESRRFQLAHQLAALALKDEISAVVESAALRSTASRQLLFVGLCNYAAGALLMPYARFRAEARAVRHDIDRLAQTFGTSFEQACHRLVHDPQRAGPAEAGELQARGGMALGDIAGHVDPAEVERHAAHVLALQRGQPVAGLLETGAEQLGQPVDVVAHRPRFGAETAIGHQQRAGRIIAQANEQQLA